jgi:hypothetical protein
MNILKNSSKYFIYKKKNSVIKIGYSDAQILKEYERINLIKREYKKLGSMMPKIYECRSLKSGPFEGCKYYRQELIRGSTLSSLISNSSVNIKQFKKILRKTHSDLSEVVEDWAISLNPIVNHGDYYIKLIENELTKISKNIILGSLVKEKISINAFEFKPFYSIVNTIISIVKQKRIKQNLSHIGHWNFHGDNIIIDKQSNLYLIDPDTNWDKLENKFSLARYYYSFPHDTIHYGKYSINNMDINRKSREFTVQHTWNDLAYKKYNMLFNDIYHNGELTNDFSLNLNFIICMMRGISANMNNIINFSCNGNSNNDGLYLYLFSINYFTDFLRKYK